MPRVYEEERTSIAEALDGLVGRGLLRSWTEGSSPTGRFRRWKLTLTDGAAWWVSRGELRILLAFLRATREGAA